MTPNQLKSRQRFIKATPLPDRAKCVNVNRRDENHIEEEESYSDNFDTFFEYEEELSQFKASNSQTEVFLEDDDSYGFIEMEEDDDEIIESISSISMQDAEESKPSSFFIMEDSDRDDENNYMSVKGFDFVQCEYMKKDGHRCKRQAPKGSTICSIHKKVIQKNKKS
tara:strand:+ start:1052 stop:1552 length:501 start_codon:yes stop_codon:yes gene_type:complete